MYILMLCVHIDKQFKNVLQGIVSKTKTKQWVVILVDSYTCTLSKVETCIRLKTHRIL